MWRSSTVFAGGTVDSGWPLTNLGEYHPSKKTRLTDMTDSYVRANFVPPEPFDLVAILNHNASPHRNLLQYSNAVGANPAKWPETNCSIEQTNITDPVLPARMERFDNSGSGSLERRVQDNVGISAYTTDRTAASDQVVLAEIYLKQVAADQHARVRLAGVAGTALVIVNLNNGTVNTSAVSGSWSGMSATVTAVGSLSNLFKLVFSATMPAAETAANFRINAVDSGFSVTFDSTAAWFYFSSPALYLASATERYDPTGLAAGARAALWRVKRDEAVALVPTTATADDDTGWLNMAQSSNPKPLSDALGTLSCYTVLANRASAYLLFEMHDPDNVVTDIDIGALWAGRSWQPTKTLSSEWGLEVDEETGMLNLRGTLSYLTAADYYADAVPLALNARIGSQASQVSIGGQEYRADSKPILVIVDDTETEYGQQQMVYGFLDQWSLGHRFNLATGANIFAVNFLVRGLRA